MTGRRDQGPGPDGSLVLGAGPAHAAGLREPGPREDAHPEALDEAHPEASAGTGPFAETRRILSVVVYAVVLGGDFGLPIAGDFSLGPEFIAFYVLLFTLAVRGMLRLDSLNVLLLGLFVCAVSTQFASGASASPTSVLLLLAIYLPLIVECGAGATAELRAHTLRAYSNAVLVLAVLAILQFASQFIVRIDGLFDARKLIPAPIAAAGAWNQEIHFGSVLKANGIFQREPSQLSLYLSLAVLVELFEFRARTHRLALFGLAMVLSLSGSGMVVLLVALFAPSGVSSLTKVAVSVAVLGLLYATADYTGLSFFTGRIDEFATPGSSGYARFVAPIEIIQRAAHTSTAGLLLGNGAGTINAAISAYPVAYEVHDPTWAKLVYEYGLVGSMVFVALIVRNVAQSCCSVELRIGLFYTWMFSGGQLLSTQFSTSLYVLCILWR